jgi:hypothetical protein
MRQVVVIALRLCGSTDFSRLNGHGMTTLENEIFHDRFPLS